MFIDVTANRSVSRISSKVYRAILSNPIQSNARWWLDNGKGQSTRLKLTQTIEFFKTIEKPLTEDVTGL